MVERLRDVGMALELGDQVGLCPCSVMLFSSGSLGREETGLTKPYEASVLPRRDCGSWLSGDGYANEWASVFSTHLISQP